MIQNKIKKIIDNFKKSEKAKTRMRFLALFLIGFLIGIVFKSQARQSILIGYDDHKIFKNNSINYSLEKTKE
jgi:TctA family transporter